MIACMLRIVNARITLKHVHAAHLATSVALLCGMICCSMVFSDSCLNQKLYHCEQGTMQTLVSRTKLMVGWQLCKVALLVSNHCHMLMKLAQETLMYG